MKRYIRLVPFLTLLLFNDTFAHDHSKNRQHLGKINRSHFEKRDQTSETEPSLTITITASIFLALNESSESAAVFDFKSNISAVINSDSVILINYENGSGVYLSQSLFNSRDNFEQFFRNLNCLKQLYQNGERNGVPFNVTSASSDVSKRVSQILNSLGEHSSPSEAPENYQKLSQSVSDIFQNSLSGFVKIISDTSANYRGDLNPLVAIFQGLQSFFSGLLDLSNRNFKLDLSKLLNQPSGLHVLNNLLEQVASHINVGQLLGDRLNSPENLFPLLNLLGGNSTEGLNGFIHVIYEVINLNQNHSNVQQLVSSLLEYSGNSSNGNQGQQFLSALQNLQNTIQKLNLGNSFQFLSHLAQNTNSSDSSNISRIVSTLLHFDPQNPINPIVAILLSMRQRVSPEESIPELFEQLISRLNSTNGRHCISNIFPNLNITNGSDGIENLILVGFHIRNFILQGIENFWTNMADFWSHIPIIGRFYEAIDRALALFTKGAVQLNKLFESQVARPRIERILGFLRGIANREENSSESGSQGVLGNFIKPILNQDKHKNGHKERHHFKDSSKHKQMKDKHRLEKQKH
ncbi:uncharacterized protein LOC123014559 [Tribolium madens]|uniref:uncharacterized protein LOC123014559 n=1 Tax=Tribolium madens TaxID=41895 RepID=UPI001CF75275|nr:uncharacterized protein LOC123014559 [Tribolium madens]